MQKQQELQQYPRTKSEKQKNYLEGELQIGTEILDPTLPSDLDFDRKGPQQNKECEEVKFQNAIHLSKPYRKSSLEGADMLQIYTIKGRNPHSVKPLFEIGKPVQGSPIQPIQVKIYDEQKKTSSGLKRFWESVVGYVKRQIAFTKGYFYIFQRIEGELFVANYWNLENLFKIFVDEEENKIRFVFSEDTRIVSKDMGIKNIQKTIQSLFQELQKGLTDLNIKKQN